MRRPPACRGRLALLLCCFVAICARASQPAVEPPPGNIAMADLPCGGLASRSLARLTLLDSAAYVLCSNPLLGQALQLVNEQQAGVALAESAYRPRFSAAAELSGNRIPSSDSSAGSLRSSATASLGVSWVLYDAGLRDANLSQSRWLRDSAVAAQQNATLTALNDALRLYAEAATASARLDALRDAEVVAQQSLRAAQAKHEALVGSLGERLQAQTALAQATLDRVRGEGAWLTARGMLALAMGLNADQPLGLADVDAAFDGLTAPVPDAQWIAQTRLAHPRLRSARADVQALKARLQAIQAEDGPSVSMGLGVASTRDLRSAGGRLDPRLSGSLYASIPIFNGPEQRAREGQVLAQIASREAALNQAERDVEADLWRNARLLETETQNFQSAKLLLSAATQSYEIAFGRYKAGVGSILELLATQNALSAARSQLVQAQLGLGQARLRLAVAAGQTPGFSNAPGDNKKPP